MTISSHFNCTGPNGNIFGRYAPGTGVRYYLKDHLGSTRLVTDQNNGVIATFDYYPFGLLMPERYTVNNSTTEKFTSKELDSSLGLYYFGMRYYNGAFVRWLSIDPYAAKYPSLSPYNYAANNPLKFIDPNGGFLLDEYNVDKETGEIAWVSNKGGDKTNYYNVGTTENDKFQTEFTFQINNPTEGINSIVSESGKDFIKSWEKRSLQAYDATGRGDWTIGWGHKILSGEDFSGGITPVKANKLFRSDLWGKSVLPILKNVKVPMLQQQFDALASYVFNVGPGYSLINTGLIKNLNAGKYLRAAYEIDITTAGGEYMRGLYLRRKAEINIWRYGIYEMHK